MSIFEKLLRGISGGHHGYRGGHHGHGKHGYPSDEGCSPTGRSTQSVSCRKCNSIVDATARFCPRCGASLTPGTCSGCNAALGLGAKFCGNCGKAVAS